MLLALESGQMLWAFGRLSRPTLLQCQDHLPNFGPFEDSWGHQGQDLS